MKQSFLLFGCLLFLFCGRKDKINNDFTMVNTWETIYLKIEMPTTQKTDSTAIFEDKFENNPSRIARSQYFSDGTFEAWFVNQKGEQLDKTKGTWILDKDSLRVAYVYAGRNIKVAYKIVPLPNGFTATSLYDWDNDGEHDDVLTMKTKSLK